jgi:predicted DNA-binding transcriptional regulator YafY
MRIDRLFGILVYLLDSGHASAAELARHFGTSARTIYRDMDALSLAGIPLVALPGAGGGYQLAERYSLDKGFLSQVELSALRAVLSPIANVSGGGSLALALGKLAALGTRDGDDLPPTIAANPFPWSWEPTEPMHFGSLRRAVEEHRLVRIGYSGLRVQEESRVIEPYTLALGGQAWYIHAFCRLRSDYRLFRLSRIETCEVLTENFEPRSRMPLPSPWSRQWGTETVIEVVIRLPPEARILILDRFPRNQVKELVSGGYEIVFQWPDGEELLRYLMSFGSGLEVVSPPELRSSLKTALDSLARLNG